MDHSLSELLAAANAAKLRTRVDGDRLVIRGPKSAEAIGQQLLDRKAEVIEYLAAWIPCGRYFIRDDTPPWDQAEADRLVAQLVADVDAIERTCSGRRFPPVTASVIGIWREACEGYVRDHALERARGWNAAELLRGAVARCLETAERGARVSEVRYSRPARAAGRTSARS